MFKIIKIIFWIIFILIAFYIFTPSNLANANSESDQLEYRNTIANESQARALQEISQTLKNIERNRKN